MKIEIKPGQIWIQRANKGVGIIIQRYDGTWFVVTPIAPIMRIDPALRPEIGYFSAERILQYYDLVN